MKAVLIRDNGFIEEVEVDGSKGADTWVKHICRDGVNVMCIFKLNLIDSRDHRLVMYSNDTTLVKNRNINHMAQRLYKVGCGSRSFNSDEIFGDVLIINERRTISDKRNGEYIGNFTEFDLFTILAGSVQVKSPSTSRSNLPGLSRSSSSSLSPSRSCNTSTDSLSMEEEIDYRQTIQ